MESRGLIRQDLETAIGSRARVAEILNRKRPLTLVDNSSVHKAKQLKIPANIILIFQPPHCPESNPIEQVWLCLKEGLRWQLPSSLEELRLLITWHPTIC